MDITFEEFEQCLFTVSRDVDEELREVEDLVAESMLAAWLTQILETWWQPVRDLPEDVHDKILW